MTFDLDIEKISEEIAKKILKDKDFLEEIDQKVRDKILKDKTL